METTEEQREYGDTYKCVECEALDTENWKTFKTPYGVLKTTAPHEPQHGASGWMREQCVIRTGLVFSMAEMLQIVRALNERGVYDGGVDIYDKKQFKQAILKLLNVTPTEYKRKSTKADKSELKTLKDALKSAIVEAFKQRGSIDKNSVMASIVQNPAIKVSHIEPLQQYATLVIADIEKSTTPSQNVKFAF